MIVRTLLPVVGFAGAVVVGFIVGKEARKATESNVNARMSSGVVIIEADLKNIAKQSLSESKIEIIDTLKSYF